MLIKPGHCFLTRRFGGGGGGGFLPIYVLENESQTLVAIFFDGSDY